MKSKWAICIKEWILKNTIKDIVNKNFTLIDGKYEEVKNGFSNNKQKIYDTYKNKVEKDKDTTINSITKDIEDIILNNN